METLNEAQILLKCNAIKQEIVDEDIQNCRQDQFDAEIGFVKIENQENSEDEDSVFIEEPDMPCNIAKTDIGNAECDNKDEMKICDSQRNVSCKGVEATSTARQLRTISWHKCDKCLFKTSSDATFEQHLENHSGAGKQKLYKCHFCDHVTIYKGNLKRHLLRHGDLKCMTSFSCDLCGYKTSFRDRLHDHMVNVHTKLKKELFKCPDCSYETLYTNNFKRHRESHKNLFRCDLCSFWSKSESSYLSHKEAHAKPIVYSCKYCDYRCDSFSSLTAHSSSHLFNCDKCEKQYSRRDVLARHLKLHSIGQNLPYSCNECSFKTTYPGSLKLHSLSHQNPKDLTQLKCSYCSYETKYKHRLIQHEKKHITSKETKMYKCEHCHYLTKDRSNINRHSLVHANPERLVFYQCYSCPFKSRHKRNLASHVKKHMMEKSVE